MHGLLKNMKHCEVRFWNTCTLAFKSLFNLIFALWKKEWKKNQHDLVEVPGVGGRTNCSLGVLGGSERYFWKYEQYFFLTINITKHLMNTDKYRFKNK